MISKITEYRRLGDLWYGHGMVTIFPTRCTVRSLSRGSDIA